ncbi:MAG: efflux RND transporter permease subunit, partial [Candidatus Peregrinibacteria bacterium]|nr:efflux RND transporter permease subunit [Candidatus Peregrinibacteria bacterium]
MSGLTEHDRVDADLKDVAGSIWGFFIFKRRMAIMLGLIFLITGVYSFFNIPRESNPEVKIPLGMVTTVYPGASPQEVAKQVTFKIEQKLKTLSDVKNMSSSSSEGVSGVVVEFEADADLDASIRKLKDKVDEAKVGLPRDAEDPVVMELSFSDTPIVNFSFLGDLPYEQLLNVVEDVQDELEKIPGVQSAEIFGKRDKHILVAVQEASMVQHGLNLRQIGQAISSFHLSSPVGNIEVDDLIYRVRIDADQDEVERVKNIPIIARSGATIYLKDVARVSEEYREATTLSRVSLNGEPSKQALSISIVKKTGENILYTADEAKRVIGEMIEDGRIPPEVSYIPISDMSEYVRTDFNRLMGNGLTTIALIFVILLFALGVKEALIGGIAIPFSFLVTFTFLNQTGNTFNFLVLFSLILGLGLLVDATIVMMEGIHENIYGQKMSPVNAALKTVKTFRYSLLSGMLTTIAAFVPMLMMSGMMGQFFKYIPTTVNTVLISSFIIGLFFIPAYAVLFMHKLGSHEKEPKFIKATRMKREHFISKVNAKYRKLLHYLLGERKRRVGLFWISMAAFVSALALPFVG